MRGEESSSGTGFPKAGICIFRLQKMTARRNVLYYMCRKEIVPPAFLSLDFIHISTICLGKHASAPIIIRRSGRVFSFAEKDGMQRCDMLYMQKEKELEKCTKSLPLR